MKNLKAKLWVSFLLEQELDSKDYSFIAYKNWRKTSEMAKNIIFKFKMGVI